MLVSFRLSIRLTLCVLAKNVWERPCTVLHINEHTTHNSLIRPDEELNGSFWNGSFFFTVPNLPYQLN